MKNNPVFWRYHILNLLLGLIFVFTGCSTRESYLTSWQRDVVSIDGKPREWMIPLRFYNVDTKLQYLVSNDLQNLYICIRSTDDKTTANIMNYGLQLWLDTLGKHKPNVGIRFPLGRQRKEDSNEGSHSRKRLMDENQQMELEGFKGNLNGISPVLSESGIKVAMGADSLGILTYELVVPFRTFYHGSLTSADSAKKMSVGFMINEFVKGSSGGGGGGGSRGGGGGHRGGGGGMRGGGGGMRGGGGMGGGGNVGSSSYIDKKSCWATMQLRIK